MVLVPGSNSLPDITRAAPPTGWGTSAPTADSASRVVKQPAYHFRSDFLGGSLAAALTSTTEKIFSSTGGTITYGAGPSSTQGMRPNSAGAGNAFLNGWPGASTVWSLGCKVTFASSTATIGIYRVLQLRSGTTVVSDVSLRNSTVTTGTREGVFRNSSNATVAGQTTGDPMTAGTTWRFQWDMDNGNSVVRIWKSHNSLGAPDYTWTQTGLSSVGPYNLMVGPDATTDVDAVISDLWASDGSITPYPIPTAPTPGSVTWTMNGHSTASSVAVKAWMSGVATARLKYSVNSDMSSASFTTAAAPDSDGYQTFSAAGLAANTVYYWVVEADGVLWPSLAGQTNTLKPAGSPQSFVVSIGSCHDTVSSAVFANEVAKGIDLKIQAGDLGYPHAASALYGNPAPADTALLRTARNATLSYTGSPGLRDLYAMKPVDQMYSDGDGGGGNADGTFIGLAGGNVQAAWRQQFAHRTLPLSDCGARSWSIGRVRIILTDETTLASAKASTDNSSKTKLGATQKAWFKAEVDAAKAAGEYILWVGDGPWIEQSSPGAGNNSWWFYQTEKAELAAYITAAGMAARISRAHGDTHTLFADDGTNNSAGGFPTFSCAPMHTSAQAFGGTVSHGKFPASGPVNNSRQYGIVTVTDDGTTLSLAYKGYSSTNAAPTETNPVSMTVTWVSATATGTGSLSLSGSGVTTSPATSSGSLSLSGSGVVAAPVTSSGSLSLSGSGVAQGAATGSGSLSLAGSGATTAAATSSGSLTLSGPGVTSAATTGAASLSLSGSGVPKATATGAGSLTLSGVGANNPQATGAGSLTLSGSGVGAGAATGSGSLTLTGSSTTTAPVTASASLTLSGTGTANGVAPGAAIGTGSITLTGSTAGGANTTAGGSLSLTGSSTTSAPVTGSGALSLSGSAVPRGAATGTGTLTLVGAATLAARATAQASLTLSAIGAANAADANAGTPVDNPVLTITTVSTATLTAVTPATALTNSRPTTALTTTPGRLGLATTQPTLQLTETT